MRTAFALIGLALLSGPSSAQPLMEADSQRFGATYARHQAQTPAACLAMCVRDAGCRAWTYVKPGHQTEAGLCELKSAAPPAARNLCCVSGVAPDPEVLRQIAASRSGGTGRTEIRRSVDLSAN